MSILVLFGSDARGGKDKYSDKDYLVIGSLEDIGIDIEPDANVNFYSKSQFRHMARVGSLFLQHVKKEGIIIQDDSGWMKTFLENLIFIEPDKVELESCLQCINTILMVPDIIELQGWKSDCLYLYLRDFIIKYLACIGHLVFSYKEMARIFFDETFKEETIDYYFFKLRENKYFYRTNSENNYFDIDFVKFELFIKQNFFAGKLNYLDQKKSFLEALGAVKFKDNFHRLKFLEACIILDKTVTDNVSNLERIISSPNHYHSSFSEIPFDLIFTKFLSENKQ